MNYLHSSNNRHMQKQIFSFSKEHLLLSIFRWCCAISARSEHHFRL